MTLEDAAGGFGWPIKLTNPAGDSANLVGQSNDIAMVIDPDTGTAISGRSASCALRISSIVAAGLVLPQGIASPTSKPWVVEFADVNGGAYKFKVAKSNPDRGMGVVTLQLEAYTS
jgi:hypothetical protein